MAALGEFDDFSTFRDTERRLEHLKETSTFSLLMCSNQTPLAGPFLAKWGPCAKFYRGGNRLISWSKVVTFQ